MAKIEHIALYVMDLERMKDFFVKYFNATANEMYHNKTTDFKSYFLSFPDSSRLEIMTRPEVVSLDKNPFSCGYIHMAMSVGSKENVDSLTEKLIGDNYQLVSGPRTTGDGCYESCILGPENNLIEITI